MINNFYDPAISEFTRNSLALHWVAVVLEILDISRAVGDLAKCISFSNVSAFRTTFVERLHGAHRILSVETTRDPLSGYSTDASLMQQSAADTVA